MRDPVITIIGTNLCLLSYLISNWHLKLKLLAMDPQLFQHVQLYLWTTVAEVCEEFLLSLSVQAVTEEPLLIGDIEKLNRLFILGQHTGYYTQCEWSSNKTEQSRLIRLRGDAVHRLTLRPASTSTSYEVCKNVQLFATQWHLFQFYGWILSLLQCQQMVLFIPGHVFNCLSFVSFQAQKLNRASCWIFTVDNKWYEQTIKSVYMEFTVSWDIRTWWLDVTPLVGL